MRNREKILFAIHRQGFHVGNQTGYTAKDAIKKYLISADYSQEDFVYLEKNYLAIQALPNIHYIAPSYKKNYLSTPRLIFITTKEKKLNSLLNLLKEKKEVYTDRDNKLIMNEIACYNGRYLPFLTSLKNTFEIEEWLISVKFQLLKDEKNYKKIINNSILYGAKKIVY